MDDNTAKVLMAIIALISAVVTPLVLVHVTKKQNKQIATNQSETKAAIGGVVEKVEVYHAEVNGKMGQLLETTKALGKAEGKAESK